jgi:hypothetical protein
MTKNAAPLSGSVVRDEQAEQKFRELASTWKAESMFLSSVTDMSSLPSYQEIIRMGTPAIPLLLGELEREPDHWFIALMSITGEDPVPAEDRGDLDKMAAAWLRWGRDRGYRW